MMIDEAKYVPREIFDSKKSFLKSFLVEFGNLYKICFLILGYCLLSPLIISLSGEKDFWKAAGVLLFPLGFFIFIFFLVQIYFTVIAQEHWETKFIFYTDRIQIERTASEIFYYTNLLNLKIREKTVVLIFKTKNGKKYFYFPFPDQVPDNFTKVLGKNK